MTIKFYLMAIENMDKEDLASEFKKMCRSGNVDGNMIYRFLMYTIPLYEATKKQLCADALNEGAKELIDWIWEDPNNPTPYSQMSVLKNIAKDLNITIDAIRKPE